MRILLIHQNFPGQFKHLAPALAAQGHEVVAISSRAGSPARWQGVRIVNYRPGRHQSKGIHPWLADFEPKVIRGEAVYHQALQLQREGFTPDLVLAHPGWGESLFIKQVWPNTRLAIYCEFHYAAAGADMGFDPEFPVDAEQAACRIAMKNLGNLMHFQVADAGLSPTRWQADSFPQPFRDRITVIHDGIDTNVLRPRPDARVTLSGQEGKSCVLDRNAEVVTFVNRNLEPYRGYHVFTRALPALLRRRPSLHVLIVGGNGVSYGTPPPPGTTWRDIYFAEVASQLSPEERARVHFLGNIPYPTFVEMLQVSTVHVYLTYPFVLSWSLLEAMSTGCAVVASGTEPVAELIKDGKTGVLTDFFDREALVERVCDLLDHPERRQALGEAARQHIVQGYDLNRVCLPGQMRWVRELVRA